MTVNLMNKTAGSVMAAVAANDCSKEKFAYSILLKLKLLPNIALSVWSDKELRLTRSMTTAKELFKMTVGTFLLVIG